MAVDCSDSDYKCSIRVNLSVVEIEVATPWWFHVEALLHQTPISNALSVPKDNLEQVLGIYKPNISLNSRDTIFTKIMCDFYQA